MRATLAVMMPAYNAAAFVEDALDSLLRQRDAAELDIIVVNDGSTDATGEIVAAKAGHASEIRLISGPHRGITRARNAAIDALRPGTEFVAMLDADDLSPPGRFARDLRAFAGDSSLDFLYGFTRMFRGVGADRLAPNPAGPWVDMRGVHLGASLMRISLLHRVGRFDEALPQGEDTDFLFRMFDLKPKIRLIDDLCVYYRRHRDNITNGEALMRSNLSRVVLTRLRRQRQGEGGLALPEGFFVGVDQLADTSWWRSEETR